MAEYLPDTIRLPFDEEAIKSKDPAKRAEYIKKLIIEIKKMYEDIASVVNQNA